MIWTRGRRRWRAGEEGTPVLRVVTDGSTREEATSTLDEICREGARRMLAAALEAEADAYIAELVGELDESGRRLVTRNRHARLRTITTGSGPIEIRAPRVNDRRVDAETGKRKRFKSSIVPPWCRTSPKVAGVLPLLYHRCQQERSKVVDYRLEAVRLPWIGQRTSTSAWGGGWTPTSLSARAPEQCM